MGVLEDEMMVTFWEPEFEDVFQSKSFHYHEIGIDGLSDLIGIRPDQQGYVKSFLISIGK